MLYPLGHHASTPQKAITFQKCVSFITSCFKHNKRINLSLFFTILSLVSGSPISIAFELIKLLQNHLVQFCCFAPRIIYYLVRGFNFSKIIQQQSRQNFSKRLSWTTRFERTSERPKTFAPFPFLLKNSVALSIAPKLPSNLFFSTFFASNALICARFVRVWCPQDVRMRLPHLSFPPKILAAHSLMAKLFSRHFAKTFMECTD